MEQKGFWLLSIILIVGLSGLTEGEELASACQCKKASSNRTNCGPPGITPQQCLDRGCCFDSAVPNVPWCFRPPPKKYIDICVIEMAYRKNCGYPGISAEVCEKKGCCFDSAPPAVPWCFFPEKVEEGC
ncbi:trefoil factor 2-like [Alligator mississippiensis]|uniref:trefoil factor 2-like n=1 Tax=Alligator mississippiensis TaxID=8496 RepID=UPI0028777D5C|nr:trefoil factor 2-like [Alligator mississippiensis]